MATTLMPTITALICGPNRITNAPDRLPFGSPVTAKCVVGARALLAGNRLCGAAGRRDEIGAQRGLGFARHGRSSDWRRIRADNAVDGARHGADAPPA